MTSKQPGKSTHIMKLLFATFVCLQLCGQAAGTFQTAYYDLMYYLFDGYQREVRPTITDGYTPVFLIFSLSSINDLDEQNQVLETTVFLTVEWDDPWLTWNTSDFSGIQSFRFPQSKLWLPDITVSNLAESQSTLGFNDLPVRITNDGIITWAPTQIFRTGCDIDVTYYPFDTQTCKIILTTMVSTDEEIDLETYAGYFGNEIDLSSFSKSGTWDLTESHVKSLPDYANHTLIEYSLTMKRLRTYYVVNIIMPVLFLSFTASMVFYLPADAGEKMGMSITVLLAFAVYLTIVADKMPQTSLQTSLISVYLTLLLGVTANGVLTSVVVLNMHHRPADEKVGKRVTFFTRKVRTFLRMDKPTENSKEVSENYRGVKVKVSPTPPLSTRVSINEISSIISRSNSIHKASLHGNGAFTRNQTEKEELEGNKVTWQIVSATVDRLCFVSYSVFIALLTTIVMLIFIVHG